MHEMSLCAGILDVIEEQAKIQKYRKVKTVFLEIGKLSGVECEAMRFCFPVVMRGTLAEDAVLEIDEIPGDAWCEHCRKSVPVAEIFDVCPDCGTYPLQVKNGRQMRIKELEVE